MSGFEYPLVLGALYLVIGLFHLQMWSRRREQVEYLWFTLLVVEVAGYVLLTSQWEFRWVEGSMVLKEAEFLLLSGIPIDPVEPRTEMLVVTSPSLGGGSDNLGLDPGEGRSSAHDTHRLANSGGENSYHHVDGWQNEEQGIEAVEDSSVAWQDRPHVLDPQIALHE